MRDEHEAPSGEDSTGSNPDIKTPDAAATVTDARAGVDHFARIVAILSFAVALGGLGFTWLQYRQSKPHVRVFAGPGQLSPGGCPTLYVTATNESSNSISLAAPTWQIHGRTRTGPASVSGQAIPFQDLKKAQRTEYVGSPTFLEPQAVARFEIELGPTIMKILRNPNARWDGHVAVAVHDYSGHTWSAKDVPSLQNMAFLPPRPHSGTCGQ